MNIILAGGGTAGHINPALAIANYIKENEKDVNILFVGVKKGLESKLVPDEGYNIKFINADGFKTSISIKNIKALTKFMMSTIKSLKIISDFKADFVIGTGGYVCAPIVFAAYLKKIPTLIHEQNVFPGSAVKFLSKFADVTATSFKESDDYLKSAKKILLTGNPIRPAILKSDREKARKELGLKDEKLIVSVGGSLGASKINGVMCDYIEKYADEKTKIILASGEREYFIVSRKLEGINKNFEVKPYIHNMDIVMAAADVLICRSGAITLSEICALGKASILIPSPNVVNNHQEYNARALESEGAAIVMLEKNLSAQALNECICELINNDEKRINIENNAKKQAITNACETIYKEIKKSL